MSGKIDYKLRAHAITVMAEREILEMWVARVLTNPERTELNAHRPLAPPCAWPDSGAG